MTQGLLADDRLDVRGGEVALNILERADGDDQGRDQEEDRDVDEEGQQDRIPADVAGTPSAGPACGGTGLGC